MISGFLNLTGKITTKDYLTGEPKTAVIELPKIKIQSNLSMKLGSAYGSPVVSDFFFTGYPKEGRRAEDESIFNITFLNSELTGDYV